MAKALDGGLKKTVGKAFRKLFLDATLTREVAAAGAQPWEPAAPTSTVYACKAIHEEYAERYRIEGLIEAGDRKVLILADTLGVDPKAGDRIMIREQSFSIVDVATDPAKATWECRARTA